MSRAPTDRQALRGGATYRPISGRALRRGALPDLLAAATAPVGGSKLLFPRRLANALAAHIKGESAAIPSAHARWFFSTSLVFWTDPAALTMRLPDNVEDDTKPIRLAPQFVDSGDWRQVIAPVSDLPEHVETQELVEFGADYTRTPTFQEMMRAIRRGRPFRRYGRPLDTEDKVHAYFRYFLALTDSIRATGFREQSRLDAPGRDSGFEVRGRFALRQRNIGVAMSADGSLLRFLGGRHRLAIAQALKVPAVPVELRLVHLDWFAAEVDRRKRAPVDALKDWARAVSLAADSGNAPIAERRRRDAVD